MKHIAKYLSKQIYVLRSWIWSRNKAKEHLAGSAADAGAYLSEKATSAHRVPQFSFQPTEPEPFSGADAICSPLESIGHWYISGHLIGRLPSQSESRDRFTALGRIFATLSNAKPIRDEVTNAESVVLDSEHSVEKRLTEANDCDGFALADIWFVNSDTLRLRLSDDAAFAGLPRLVQGFQYDPNDPDHLVGVARSTLCSDMMEFVDVGLLDPYAPVLLVLSNLEGEIASVVLVPFPSLCRGGVHYGELLAEARGASYMLALQQVGRRLKYQALSRGGRAALQGIRIDLMRATGTEKIFDPALKRWLTTKLGIGIAPGYVPSFMSEAVRGYLETELRSSPIGDQDNVLYLPADAIPSLHAIFMENRALDAAELRAFVLSSDIDLTPHWLLQPPKKARSLSPCNAPIEVFPILQNARLSETVVRSEVVSDNMPTAAIRFRSLAAVIDERLLIPEARAFPSECEGRGTDAQSVSVVLDAQGDVSLLGATLEAIALQDSAPLKEVFIVCQSQFVSDAKKLADKVLPDCSRVVACLSELTHGERLNQALSQAQADLILIVGEGVILHNSETIASLVSSMRAPDIASATCPLLIPQGSKQDQFVVSAGYGVTSHVSGGDTGKLIDLSDIVTAIPGQVWPIRYNTCQLVMIRTLAWRKYGGFTRTEARSDELVTPFWVNAISDAKFHLLNGEVTASSLSLAKKDSDAFLTEAEFPVSFGEASCVSIGAWRLVP